jgi:leader peptidase (prepilin peptidase)/N-methyltransferase
VTPLVAVAAAVLGLAAGRWVQRTAAAFVPARTPVPAGALPEPSRRSVSTAVPAPVSVLLTAVLCGLAGLRFGASAALPAYLVLAVAGALLAVVDLEHRVLPTRFLRPALGAGAVLLTVAAAVEEDWAALLGALLGCAVLYGCYLALAVVAPSGLGMGDVRFAGVLGLYLGWLGWDVVLVGALAGVVVQAVVALVLLAAGRIGLRGAVPFGPAMLLGAVLAIGWGAGWADAYLGLAG